jgi:hypothetical protein
MRWKGNMEKREGDKSMRKIRERKNFNGLLHYLNKCRHHEFFSEPCVLIKSKLKMKYEYVLHMVKVCNKQVE